MERSDSDLALLDFDQMETCVVASYGSFGYESAYASDAEYVKSFNSREMSTDESEMMNFRSLHSLGHSLSFITQVPELCDIKFLVGDDEDPVYGIKAVIGTRSRPFYSLILKHMKKAKENHKPKQSTPRKSKWCFGMSQHLEIPVRRYDTCVFRRLIHFVHSGSVNITMETVVGLLCGAVQFGFKDLEKACLEMIQRGISKGLNTILITTARDYSQHKHASELLSKLHGKGDTNGNR
ncbi:hypothetical protein ACJMK2_023426 [Sinanodonta woodiana]|uniref:BTB domain-containing protein n=1 Tax=Sinanodonta woodiana TaxID=1069815 RepID=A0ABD3T473_SINWO